ASLFNETDVSLDIGSTGDDLHVSVKVKIPGGGLVPLIVIKDAIKGSKKAIEKQTGLKVSLDNKSIALMSTTTARPPTTFPPGVIISTPTRSIIPGLHDYWAVIVCAVAATLFLLAITLCFTFHANRIQAPRDRSHRNSDSVLSFSTFA
ncbi:uncharacterized protein LOC114574717, partial [Exaiptasia diaphana]|uniref:Uncharacterized protein n=1 Tax=Exaiptasia diaphana TaxID=2652724 RepID=A0A913YEV0_EXADI